MRPADGVVDEQTVAVRAGLGRFPPLSSAPARMIAQACDRTPETQPDNCCHELGHYDEEQTIASAQDPRSTAESAVATPQAHLRGGGPETAYRKLSGTVVDCLSFSGPGPTGP